jgi:hypothetical protein
MNKHLQMNQTFSIMSFIRCFLLLATTSVATLAPINRTGIVLDPLPSDMYQDNTNPLLPSREAPMLVTWVTDVDTQNNVYPSSLDQIDPLGPRPVPDRCHHQRKNASGGHTLLRATTCTLSAQGYVANRTSLARSNESGSRSVAVISGNNETTGLLFAYHQKHGRRNRQRRRQQRQIGRAHV